MIERRSEAERKEQLLEQEEEEEENSDFFQIFTENVISCQRQRQRERKRDRKRESNERVIMPAVTVLSEDNS